MPRLRPFALLMLSGGAFTACEQAEQPLPFETFSTQVTRTVDHAGAVISTAAGASFRIPSGAVAAGTTVTLTSAAAPAIHVSGTPAGAYTFAFSGGDHVLAAPVPAEFRILRAHPQSWLASATVTTPTGTLELGDAGVDIASGVVRTRIPVFGMITPVIPAADAVVEVAGIGAPASGSPRSATRSAAALSLTSAIRGECGDGAARCEGLEVRVGEDLLDFADRAAIVFPRVRGEIRIDGTHAAGTMELHAPLRLRLRSGANAVTVPVRITATPSAATVVTEFDGRITLSDVTIAVRSSTRDVEETGTLVVEYQGTRAWFSISQTIGAGFAGVSSTPTFAATVPLVRVPLVSTLH